MNLRFLAIVLLLLPLPATPAGTRLKDLVSIEGVRDNQLVGYGLVVGLNGTGDKVQTVFSTQSLTNLLARMGVQINPTLILVKNIAAVLVTANLPPFAQPGTQNRHNRCGHRRCLEPARRTLILTPLKGRGWPGLCRRSRIGGNGGFCGRSAAAVVARVKR